MSQSSVIFAALLLGFLIFITMRGDLKSWLGIFGI